MGPCAACELNSSRNHPRVISAHLTRLGFCLWQSRNTVAAQSLNGQSLCATPRWASILINEWVSYGTAEQYEDQASTTPINFSVTGENRNWPGGVLSLFYRAKLSCIFLTFTLSYSIMAVQLRKSVISASYLTTHPSHSVPYSEVTSTSFSRAPGIYFFPSQAPLPSTFPLRGQFPWHLWASTPTQHLLTGWEFHSIFQPSPTQCLDREWLCPGCFTKGSMPHLSIFLLEGGR